MVQCPHCDINTSFALILRGKISDASIFSNSSISAISMSPFQILPRDWRFSKEYEILAGSWSGNQVVKSKSTSLFRSSLMLGKITDRADASRRWEGQVEEFQITDSYKELFDRLSSSGMCPQDLRHWKSSKNSRKTCKNTNIEPENFEYRIIFMSMFSDIWFGQE